MVELGKITGQTFLVTGGASGLGAQYVETFLKEGAKYVAILDIAEDAGKSLSGRLEKDYPGKAVFIRCDISNEDNVREAFEEVIQKFGRLDTIVNNAGVMNDSPNVWAKMCDINMKGLVSLTSKGIEHMRRDKGGAGGTIVNVSSVLGLIRSPFLPVYCSTKIAVLHFSQCIAVPPFFEQTGVRILTICFGPTDTPLLHGLEKLTFSTIDGNEFTKEVEKTNVYYQTVAGAVKSFMGMYRNGAPGTVWLSKDDKPVVDVTGKIEQAYDIMNKIVEE